MEHDQLRLAGHQRIRWRYSLRNGDAVFLCFPYLRTPNFGSLALYMRSLFAVNGCYLQSGFMGNLLGSKPILFLHDDHDIFQRIDPVKLSNDGFKSVPITLGWRVRRPGLGHEANVNYEVYNGIDRSASGAS